MPSVRGPTTPQSSARATHTPEYHMSFTPPGTRSPASPQSSIATPDRDSVEKAKLQNVPVSLRHFLQPDLDLDSRSITKAHIEQIVKHFEPDVKVSPTMSKPAHKCLFYEHVAPLIKKHSAVNNVNPVSSPTRAHGLARGLLFQEYAHAFNPSFDPKHRNSTKKILHAAIRHKSPNQPIAPLNLIKKPALIALFEHHVHRAPASRARFADIPPVLADSELQSQTKDELRFALQAHIPELFILSHVNKPALINIYQRFLLSVPDAPSNCAQEQVDFFLFNNDSA